MTQGGFSPDQSRRPQDPPPDDPASPDELHVRRFTGGLVPDVQQASKPVPTGDEHKYQPPSSAIQLITIDTRAPLADISSRCILFASESDSITILGPVPPFPPPPSSSTCRSGHHPQARVCPCAACYNTSGGAPPQETRRQDLSARGDRYDDSDALSIGSSASAGVKTTFIETVTVK
ncbi:hypothetical protein DCS_06153 [Drechmeria coniospora]|uniref:Uncharacterized protein n=1 Tax=Drechmeria coniospora TaxID=98403 RepID=A0A151GAS0_DRECN|nr:hypothetical protein DCS_06153 [Drechmeria coniospora]KYK54196.1 hypothetical protein DCS_06153 [Drechmeria coniospora]